MKALLRSLIALATLLFVAINLGAADETDKLIFHNNENSSMKIALTFDDGPHPYYTKEILDILDKYNVTATFFVVGRNAEIYPDAFREISLRGHEIGNHTYTHSDVFRMSENVLADEIEKCEESIYQFSEQKTKLFRPPEGYIDNDVKKVARALNYKIILWDIDTLDWAHNSPENIAEVVLDNVKSGNIILMHDYNSYGTPTPEALEMIIPALLSKGYKFVGITELIGAN